MISESVIEQFQRISSNQNNSEILLLKKRVLFTATKGIIDDKDNSLANYHKLAKSFLAEDYEVYFLTIPITEGVSLGVGTSLDFNVQVDGVRYLNGTASISDTQKTSSLDVLVPILDEFVSVYRPSIIVGLDSSILQLASSASALKAGASYLYEVRDGVLGDHFHRGVSGKFELKNDSIIAYDSCKEFVDGSQNYTLSKNLYDIAPLTRLLEEGNSNTVNEKVSKSNQGRIIEKVELQGSEPTWHSIDTSNLDHVNICARVAYNGFKGVNNKKAVLLFKLSDFDGNDISKKLPQLAYSSHLKSKFKYISDTSGELVELHNIEIPPEAKLLEVGFCAFNCADHQSIALTDIKINTFDTSKAKSSKVQLSSKPLSYTFDVEEFLPHQIKAEIIFNAPTDKINKKALIAGITYYDDNDVIEPPYIGFAPSKVVGPCAYLNNDSENILRLVPPKNAKRAELKLQSWHAKDKVWINGKVECVLDTETKTIATMAEKAKSTVSRPLSKVKVAAIVDEFTLECFRMEVDLLCISPTNWRNEFEEFAPDLLFVESCWFGNKKTWGGLMYGYTSNGPNHMDALIQVINYCRKKGIPTVFWSKEDPVHYSRFAPTAKLFDYVYTTDANMVQSYKSEYDIDAEPLSFFCQPKVHNPVEVIARSPKAAFAGSYYSDKQERCDDFHTILGGLDDADVPYDIYDRCLKRGVSHLQFPEYFKKHVVGYLEPDEMWKAYKGYRYTVNMNTVKHSPTMFARRVYESLASGTPVISNYSEGVVTQFSGIVCASDDKKDIIDYVEMLKDEKEYKRIAEEGARETLGRHTIADRLEQVCKRVGIAVIPHLPIVNAVITAGTVDMVEKARKLVNSQTYFDKRLVVNLENSNELYPYLNMNSDKEIFRVLTEFAKPLEGVSVDLDLHDYIAETLMEDVAIKTQYDNLHPAISEKQ